jgi:hypothetical protein
VIPCHTVPRMYVDANCFPGNIPSKCERALSQPQQFHSALRSNDAKPVEFEPLKWRPQNPREYPSQQNAPRRPKCRRQTTPNAPLPSISAPVWKNTFAESGPFARDTTPTRLAPLPGLHCEDASEDGGLDARRDKDSACKDIFKHNA